MDAVQQAPSNPLACGPSGCGAAPTVPTEGIAGALSTQGCPCTPIPPRRAWSSASFSPSWARKGWGGAAPCLSEPSKNKGCTEIAAVFPPDLCLGINVCFVRFEASES